MNFHSHRAKNIFASAIQIYVNFLSKFDLQMRCDAAWEAAKIATSTSLLSISSWIAFFCRYIQFSVSRLERRRSLASQDLESFETSSHESVDLNYLIACNCFPTNKHTAKRTRLSIRRMILHSFRRFRLINALTIIKRWFIVVVEVQLPYLLMDAPASHTQTSSPFRLPASMMTTTSSMPIRRW